MSPEGNGILHQVLQFVTFTEISSEIHIKILWTYMETEIFYGWDPVSLWHKVTYILYLHESHHYAIENQLNDDF